MYSWIAGLIVRRTVGHINRGELEPVMRSYAKDATLVFPGEHSWGATYRGKAEIERLFRRVHETGLRFVAGEVLAKGPPWSMTVCFQLFDRVRDPDGTVVYANRVMELMKVAWGKIRYQEVYLDTQKVAGLDRHLGVGEPAGP
jgi:ketosteroid isomerase-like protein